MQIEAKAGQNTCLYFYGAIYDGYDEEKSFDEVTVKNLFKDIKNDEALDIYINSPGGSVFSALAINGILSGHKGPITIYVTGLAASAATLITSVRNAKCVMPKGSLMMIHNPIAGAYGNKNDLNHTVEVLEKVATSIRSVYEAKTGLNEEKLKQLMDEETWLTAEEALELGFVDEIDESQAVTAQIEDHFLAIGGCKFNLWQLPTLREDLFNKMETKNEKTKLDVQSIKIQYPELFKEITNNAISSERDRIKALLDVDVGTNHNLVMKAMFDEPSTAEKVAIATVKAQKNKEKEQAKALIADGEKLAEIIADVNLSSEGALPANKNTEEKDAFVKAIHNNLKKINGYRG